MTKTDEANIIKLPTPEAPAEIRESFRSVLRSHMFVVAREVPTPYEPEPTDLVALDAERFESLLVELGNNAMQRINMLAINHALDEEEHGQIADCEVAEANAAPRTPKKATLHDIKWSDAEAYARDIARACRDSGFVAPELWQDELNEIARMMDGVATALCMRPPPPPPAPDVAPSSPPSVHAAATKLKAEWSGASALARNDMLADLFHALDRSHAPPAVPLDGAWSAHIGDLRRHLSTGEWSRVIWILTTMMRQASLRWHETAGDGHA